MTFLALTVAPDHVLLTQDSGAADTIGRPALPLPTFAETYQEAYRDFWRDDRAGPEPVEPEITLRKVWRVGEIAVGGIGAGLAPGVWAHELQRAGITALDDAVGWAPMLRASMLASSPRDRQDVQIPASHLFLVGLSARLGGPAAYVCSAPLYRPVQLGVGHTLHPVPCDQVDGYSALCEGWEPAVAGVGTAAFHAACYGNVTTAWRERRLRNWSTFGGPLQIAEVTRAGLAVRRA